MSSYATLWQLQFPRDGDAHPGCEWVRVLALGLPADVGTPPLGYGYESGDPVREFLPSVVPIDGGVL